MSADIKDRITHACFFNQLLLLPPYFVRVATSGDAARARRRINGHETSKPRDSARLSAVQ